MYNTTAVRYARSRRPSDQPGLIWVQMAAALAGGLLVFLFVLVFLSMGYGLLYAGRMFPGITVAGVDISGLSMEEAAVKLSNTLTFPYSGRIVLRDGGNVWVTTPAQLGMVFDPVATAELAYKFGRSPNPLKNLNDQLNSLQVGIDLPPVSAFDQRMAYTYLQNLAREIDRPAEEAFLTIEGLQVTAQPGRIGRTLNVDASLVFLNAQMLTFRDGEVPLVILEQPPAVMDASLQVEQARRLLSAPLVISLPNAGPGDPGPWAFQPEELAEMLVVNRVPTENGMQVRLELDRRKLGPRLMILAGSIDRPAANPRFIFNDDTRQLEIIQSALVGRTVDVNASIQAIEDAIVTGQQNVPLVIDFEQPLVQESTTAAELGITELVISYSTYFYGSSASRLQNIKAAAEKFHGLLIPPGATFSMGEWMGDISLDNGFAEALIIYGGQTIKGVGGGVCQVSTTLFRAAFFAGFPVVERHAHAYRVNYYEMRRGGGYDPGLAGLDATVYFPLVDFKFTNDTPYWLLMETYFNPNSSSLEWKFYSTKDGRVVTYETTGPQNVIPAPEPSIRLNPEFSKGELRQVDYAADGANVTVTRTVTRDGKIHFIDKFVTYYQPWRAICEYGPGTEDPEKLAERRGICQP